MDQARIIRCFNELPADAKTGMIDRLQRSKQKQENKG
jgi:hypothetical protein